MTKIDELRQQFMTYQATKHDTKGSGGRELEAATREAFAELTAANSALMAKPELKASESRDFEANLRVMSELKSWLSVFELDQQPQRTFEARPAQDGGHKGGLGFSREQLEELHDAATSRRPMSVKGVSVSTAPFAGVADYRMDVLGYLRDRTRIRDFLPTETTTAGSVQYFRALAAATASAFVAEGADKPESSPTWETVQAQVRKIAHYAKVNDEVIADFGQWMAVIGDEMIAGMVDAENDALLNGTGVAPAFEGLLVASGIQTQAFSNSNVETIAKGFTKLRTGAAYTEPDVIVLNPAQWENVALFRVGGSTTTDGPYLIDPTAPKSPALWNVPVIVTTKIAAGTGMVANLKTAAKLYIREDARLEVNPYGGEAEWKANKTLIRAEERLALTVERPKAVVKLTGLA